MLLQNFIYGLIIGLGFIIPGVSGGVIATILGIYYEITDRILNFFHDIKNNTQYILPIIFGIIISVLIFSKVILFLLEEKLIFISYVFIGLILGSIPCLLKEIKNKTNKNISLIPFIVTFIIGIILFIIEKNCPQNNMQPNFFIMILTGIIYAIGKIVPGISGAALLMLIGVYEYFLKIIAHPFSLSINVIISLIPFFISFCISSIIILKLMNYLLNKHFRTTYSAIIGFVISSLLFIYPNAFNLTSLIVTLSSFVISYYLSE